MSTAFHGADRMEVRAAFGRPVRVGEVEALAASDAVRVREALAAGDAARARSYVDILVPLYDIIILTYLEWGMAVLALVARDSGADAERTLARRARDAWEHAIGQAPPPVSSCAIALIRNLIDPDRANATAVEGFRGAQGPMGSPLAQKLNAQPIAHRERCLAAIEAGRFAEASEAFDAYQAAVRDRHDLIGRYVCLQASVLSASIGQTRAVARMQEGLESCAALAGMWGFVEKASPEDVALMLAEHLRSHFSGRARDGAVEIVDEPDRIRLVFEPCGSGGALRRDGVPGHALLPDATPETWHRANEVPAYCAHCAKNELTSLAKFGRLAWVTEFDPDPAKPCGWTVYKDPAKVPDHYFTRVGAKPPRR